MGSMIIVGPNGKRFRVNAPAGTSIGEVEETFARQNGGARGTVVQNEPADLAELRSQYEAFTSTPEYQSRQTGLGGSGIADYVSNPNSAPVVRSVRAQPARVVPENPEDIGLGRKVGDLATGVYSGLANAVGATVGLGTYVKHLNKIADPTAEFFYGAGEEVNEAFLSDFQLAKKRELQADLQASVEDMPPYPEDSSAMDRVKFVADYVVKQGGAAAGFIKDNPGQVTNLLAETLPYIFTGGAIGKGTSTGLNLLDGAVSAGSRVKSVTAKAAEVGGKYAGAIGEGLVAAGDVGAGTAISQREQGNYDYDPQRLYGLLTAPATAVVGGLGSRVSGVADVDALAARAFGAGTTPTNLISLPGRVAKGAAVEGAEELVQGGTEQVFSNLANDEDVYQGVGGSAVLGLAAGSSLGAAVNLRKPSSQGTELDSQEAQLLANEELELQASALADEKAAAVQAQAEVETTARVRREAATTFTPRKKFVADRLKVISQRLEADIRNPQTELGQAFEASINEQGIFDPADVETEAKAFLKGYQKETKAASEAQIAEEYVAALDSHAEAVARGDQPTVDLSTETQGDTATDAASQEAVAKPAKPPTKKEQLRALAVEQLGENFESDHPELSQLLSDGKGIYSRGSGKKSRFESMLGKAVAEQAAEAQPTETQAQQPPITVEQAAAPAAQEDVAAPPVVAEKAPEASEVLTGMDAQAETYAKEKLGDNWRESNPPLVELLNGKKYAGFQSNVDKVAQAQATLAPAAVEIKPAPVADVAQQISDSDPTTSSAFLDDSEVRAELKPQQQVVYDAILKAANDNTLGDLFSVTFESGDTNTQSEPKANTPTPDSVIKSRRTAQRTILKDAGVKEKTILDVFKTKTVEPSAKDKMKFPGISATKQPRRQAEQVSILEAAGVSSDIITTFEEAAGKQPEKKAPKERGFKVEANNALLKSLSGITNQQSAATATSAVVSKLREKYGNDGLREMLIRSGVAMGGGIEVADTATANDLLAEGGAATGTISSAGGSQSAGAATKMDSKAKATETKLMKAAGMTADDIKSFYAIESTVPELAETDGDAATRAAEEASLGAMSGILAQSWDSSASRRNAPLFDDLTMDQKIEWMHYSNTADASNAIDRFDVLDKQQREIERAATSGTETQNEQVSEPQTEERNEEKRDTRAAESTSGGSSPETVSNADAGPTPQGSSTEETQQVKVKRVTPEEVKAKRPELTDEQAKNIAGVTNGARARTAEADRNRQENSPEDNEQFSPTLRSDAVDTGVVGGVKTAPVVEVKKRKKIVRPKFSLDDAEASATGTTAGNVRDAVKWLIGEDANWRVSVVKSPQDLIGMVLSKEVDIDGLTLGSILDRSNAQGVVVTDNDGVTRAFLFSDNITPGNERGAVIHEVGSHLGMDNVLTREQLTTATGKIRAWASEGGTSLQKTIAQRALDRVSSAEKQGAVADPDSEVLAYFLEEAVNAGVTPNSDSKSPLVQFIRQIWADFKRALRKLRPANEAALTPQDLVNMARGAARLELATDFHGSTSAFRTVNPDYFGLGNNAVGVGFYISEDQAEGTQYMVQRMDERQSTGGALQRIDTAVAENEYLDWEARMGDQPRMIEAFNKLPEEIQDTLLDDFGAETVDSLTGRQFYIGLTQQQLRDYRIEEYVSDTAYDRAQRHSRGTTTAMELVSAFLDANGIKGIKTKIRTNLARSYRPSSSNPNPMFNKIIFSDKNVVVVGRNDAGDVDVSTTTPGTIKFSVPPEETNKQVDWIKANMGKGAGEAATNLLELAKAPLTATKNLDRVIRDNEEALPSARVWMDTMLDAEATRNEVLGMVEGVVNQTRQFKMDRREAINDVVGASTFFQKWGYDPQWTDAKGAKIKVKVDPTMKRKFDRLTAEEQQTVRDLFSHGRTLQIMMQDIAKALGVSQFFKLDSKLEGPYAPLKRFGDYVAQLKSQALLDAEAALKNDSSDANRKKVEDLKSSGDHYVISFFDSQGAADTFKDANRDKFAEATASQKTVGFDEARTGGAQAYEKILGAVNANMAGLEQADKDAMAKMVRDMYFQTLDDSNARLSGARRLNRAGYDKNMIRSFATHGMAQANLIAQLKHGAAISAALVETRQEAGTSPRKLMPIYNQIAQKFRAVMTPRTGMFASLEDSVMKFNSFYMLTSSMGYFFQNMTQPYFAVANIAEISGYSQQPAVWGKLLSGYGVARKVINTGFMNQVKNVASMGRLGA